MQTVPKLEYLCAYVCYEYRGELFDKDTPKQLFTMSHWDSLKEVFAGEYEKAIVRESTYEEMPWEIKVNVEGLIVIWGDFGGFETPSWIYPKHLSNFMGSFENIVKENTLSCNMPIYEDEKNIKLFEPKSIDFPDHRRFCFRNSIVVYAGTDIKLKGFLWNETTDAVVNIPTPYTMMEEDVKGDIDTTFTHTEVTDCCVVFDLFEIINGNDLIGIHHTSDHEVTVSTFAKLIGLDVSEFGL